MWYSCVQWRLLRGSRMQTKSFAFSLFGYGFLEVWSFYMLFGGTGTANHGLFAWVAVAGVIALATLAIVLRFSHIKGVDSHKTQTVAAALLNVAGTAAMLYGAAPLNLVGIAVASIGNAWLWVSWGDVYCRLDTEAAERCAMGSALLQVVLLIVLMPLGEAVGATPVLLAAPLSCLFYCLAVDAPFDEVDETECIACADIQGVSGKAVVRMALGLGAPIMLMYLWWDLSNSTGFLASDMNNVVIVGLLVFMVTFLVLIRFMPTISVPFICQVELSLVVAACLLSCLQGMAFMSRVLIYAAMLVSEYLNLLYSARLFRNGFGGAVFTFAVVQLINHTAGWMGDMCAAGFVYADALDQTAFNGLLCMVCAVAFFVMIIMGNTAPSDNLAISVVDNDGKTASDKHLLEIAGRFALTPRETEVFLLLAKGRSAPFIRDELVISLNTVTSHTRRIYRKMDIHSRQELLDLVAR